MPKMSKPFTISNANGVGRVKTRHDGLKPVLQVRGSKHEWAINRSGSARQLSSDAGYTPRQARLQADWGGGDAERVGG